MSFIKSIYLLSQLIPPEKISEDIKKEFLEAEWSMGNGQCPECYGLSPNKYWYYGRDYETGHKKDCLLMKSLQQLGFKVVLKTDIPVYPDNYNPKFDTPKIRIYNYLVKTGKIKNE